MQIFSSFEDNNNGGEIVLASTSQQTSCEALKPAMLERKLKLDKTTHITLYATTIYNMIQLRIPVNSYAGDADTALAKLAEKQLKLCK